MSRIEFFFAPFSTFQFSTDKNGTILVFGFESQEDPEVTRSFPELEDRRKSIDKIEQKGGEVVTLQTIVRGDSMCQAGLIYIRYPWRKKKEIMVGGINFLREIFCLVKRAVEKVNDEGRQTLSVVLPVRFSPQNVKDKEQRDHLYQFVKTVTEAIVYANEPYTDFKKSSPESKISTVTFLFFGEPEKALDEFLRTAIVEGETIGRALTKTRRLIELPPNLKTPHVFVSEILNQKISTRPSGRWKKIPVSSRITAHVLCGEKTLKTHGFELMAAVNSGSVHDPYFLRLHYKPKTTRQKRVRKVVVTGKGVLFDTGGHNLKSVFENMHHDMAGAATAAAIPFLAEELNLPVEIIVLAPIVQNMIGSEAVLPHSIYRAYGGTTVEILDTDCEGRLILGEAIAYGEEKFKPDATITLGTLGDLTDFAPDFLKVGVVGKHNVRRAKLAERSSAEKILLLPPMEHFNLVDEMHVGSRSDIVNDLKNAYHSAPFVFLYNFFKHEPNWFFIDNSLLMEEDAQEYGVGPGFGVKFLWYLIKQFS